MGSLGGDLISKEIKSAPDTGDTFLVKTLFLHDSIVKKNSPSTKIKGSPVFWIENVSILNGHNFDPERRTKK